MRPAGVVLDDGVQSMKIGDGIANVTARLTGMRVTQDVQELSELIAPRQA
ncbi:MULTISPECIES: hypothetical protein [unclassified Streptomyces]